MYEALRRSSNDRIVGVTAVQKNRKVCISRQVSQAAFKPTETLWTYQKTVNESQLLRFDKMSKSIYRKTFFYSPRQL